MRPQSEIPPVDERLHEEGQQAEQGKQNVVDHLEMSISNPRSSWRSKLREVKTVMDAPMKYPEEEGGPRRHYKYHSVAAHLDKRSMKP